ncbi:hypothetical protein [Geitlerinema sp. PCC 9228]|jgi:hypothetical protein|uniref:hypothetical protein n=1 Tax=Geitlerinema sp. PCC 9228 TaxID=111611 RepID=UPI0008F9E385|nr:hypothetical protein [Geitlerinema sp. PCC 9228]
MTSNPEDDQNQQPTKKTPGEDKQSTALENNLQDLAKAIAVEFAWKWSGLLQRQRQQEDGKEGEE